MVNFGSLRKLIFFFLFLNIFFHNYAQDVLSGNRHEVTLYIMPTLEPLNWESPSHLYKSMNDCYLKTIGMEDNYLLGHVAVELSTPLLEKSLLIAQTSGSLKEKLDLIFRQKVGFGIIGAAMQGRIETDTELRHKIQVYQKRNKLAILKYDISLNAMKRILSFVEEYSSRRDGKTSPSDFYGGAFWPRYYNEGSGCSAFAMSLLELIQLLPETADEWRKDVRIPINLVGGDYNRGLKVKRKTILKTTEWYNGSGQLNVDYVKYSVYEPSVMFDWILKTKLSNDTLYKPFEQNGIPGLYVDARNIPFDNDAPLFIQRPEANLFIDVYYKKTGMKSTTITTN